MTALELRAPRRSDPFAHAPLFAGAGMFIILSLGVTLPAMYLDPRLFQDESVWLKPVKFQIALAIYLLTLAFFARWLPEGMTRRRWWRVYAAAVVVAIGLELLWISGAGMFGVASHFNRESAAMMMLYNIAGPLAVLLTSASLVMGVAIWRNRASGLPDAVRLSIGLGLVLTFVLTVVVAATMAQGPGHLVGTPETDAAVPVFGWSREVGDLRVSHLFATHALHVLPLAGLAAAWALPPVRARAAVWAAALAYIGLVALTFAQALSGQPFLA
jgi:hypothetical protein